MVPSASVERASRVRRAGGGRRALASLLVAAALVGCRCGPDGAARPARESLAAKGKPRRLQSSLPFDGEPPQVELPDDGEVHEPWPKLVPARRPGDASLFEHPYRLYACDLERGGSRTFETQRGERRCLVRMRGGTFPMGAQAADPNAPGYDPDAAEDEGPVREVTLPGFWFASGEASFYEYAQCVREGACRAEDVLPPKDGLEAYALRRANDPVRGVTWSGADRYCRWAGGRLPTEAEWEWVAKGPSGRRYPWGAEPPTCDRAIMRSAAGAGCGEGLPAHVTWSAEMVANLKTSPLTGPGNVESVLNLAGNVAEWVGDWYAPYPPGAARAPQGPPSGEERVLRGGSFETEEAALLRTTARDAWAPDEPLADVGIRCAADAVYGRFPYSQVREAYVVDEGGDSPFAGRWRLRGNGQAGVALDGLELVVADDGGVLKPGVVEGRIEPDGRLRLVVSPFLLVDGRCRGHVCEGAVADTFNGTRVAFVATRARWYWPFD
jgi:formylglycine-generating enzyme required for sulfatase activity